MPPTHVSLSAISNGQQPADAGHPEPMQTLDSWDADVDLLTTCIKEQPGELEILEAGCGRAWPLRLDGVRYRLSGMDLDEAALSARVNDVRDLHEAIVGDLCTPGLIPANTYDVIYNSFVLEHIKDAELALKNMMLGLKPGGILLLRIPDRHSVFGWTTRFAPFWIHVAYYRYVLRLPNAGKPGHGPYFTYHAPIVSRQGIRAFCEANNCTILEERAHTYYLSRKQPTPGQRLVLLATRLYAQTVSWLSLGKLDWRHNNLTYIIRKN
jgi:SAM-dependent methyltransferase